MFKESAFENLNLKEGFNGVVAWTVNGYFFPILTLDGYYW